jgi:EAL domain-containing protein (putative c-di-GMP-specific phosphodiesterase class I)
MPDQLRRPVRATSPPSAAARPRLAQQLLALERAGGLLRGGMLSVVVDQLTDLNDQLGWADADRVLASASQRLEEMVGRGAVAAHLGGGLVLVVVPRGAVSLAVAAVQEAPVLDGGLPGRDGPIPLHCRVSEVPLPSTPLRNLVDAIALVERCERWARLGHAAPPDAHRAGHRIGPDAPEVAAMVSAVDGRAIQVQYQPIFDLRSGALVGAEALARWPEAPEGVESPEHFLHLAAVAGRQRDVTDHILDCVSRAAARPALVGSGTWLSVNLSATEAVGADLPGRVLAALARHRVDPDHIVLELSERIIPDLATQRSISGLRGAGLRVAIDDFGSGWSSIAQLTELPIELVKLDRSIIESARSGPALLEASVALAEALDLRVLAEGIETPEDLAAVQAAGVHLGQGFLLGGPSALDDLERLVLDQRA